jgi:predicted DNA-binding ribbon-helix-helix protein
MKGGTAQEGAAIRKRSVLVSGHATSVSVEQEFWDALKQISARRDQSVNDLISELDLQRGRNLSSAIRVFVLREVAGNH